MMNLGERFEDYKSDFPSPNSAWLNFPTVDYSLQSDMLVGTLEPDVDYLMTRWWDDYELV